MPASANGGIGGGIGIRNPDNLADVEGKWTTGTTDIKVNYISDGKLASWGGGAFKVAVVAVKGQKANPLSTLHVVVICRRCNSAAPCGGGLALKGGAG